MLELIQRLIAYKYACKLRHWQARNYGAHLLYDRLIENVDNWVDDLAEKIYMAAGEAGALTQDILNPQYVETDIVGACTHILELIDRLASDNSEPEGVPSLLGDISKDFLTKLALARMENGE